MLFPAIFIQRIRYLPLIIQPNHPYRQRKVVPDFVGVFRQLDPFEFGFATSSKRQSSTSTACAENSAKLTPSPSQVAPSGNGLPPVIRERRRLEAARVRASSERATDPFPPKKEPLKEAAPSSPSS